MVPKLSKHGTQPMPSRMPCHLSDGPQDPDDAIPGLDDLSENYPEIDVSGEWAQMKLDDEKERQADIDSLRNNLEDIARSAAMECPACGKTALEAQRIIRKHVFSDRQQRTQNFTMYKCSECGIETAFTGGAA